MRGSLSTVYEKKKLYFLYFFSVLLYRVRCNKGVDLCEHLLIILGLK